VCGKNGRAINLMITYHSIGNYGEKDDSRCRKISSRENSEKLSFDEKF
jgi:hypothetical protein